MKYVSYSWCVCQNFHEGILTQIRQLEKLVWLNLFWFLQPELYRAVCQVLDPVQRLSIRHVILLNSKQAVLEDAGAVGNCRYSLQQSGSILVAAGDSWGECDFQDVLSCQTQPELLR